MLQATWTEHLRVHPKVGIHRKRFRQLMTQTWIQGAFIPFKKFLPRWLSNLIRSTCTAFLTPVLFSWRTGHFKSSFKMMAVSKRGRPLPWYTYPSIDFLKGRDYTDKSILEFGAGQSTLWWAQRAKSVLSFEADAVWMKELATKVPSNVTLHKVSGDSSAACVSEIQQVLRQSSSTKYDVVVIDGVWRSAMIEIACHIVSDTGVIICDNAEGYGFYEGFKDRDFQRVDFFGNAPGVVLPHCTSVYFRCESFLFDPSFPVLVIAKEQDNA